VADVTINELIGWSHKNLGRFLGVNEHCSFTPVNRPRFCTVEFYRGYFWSVGPVPFDTSCFYLPINRPIYRDSKLAGKSADLSASGATA